jgi:2-dehydro-3-deoxygluconokinase
MTPVIAMGECMLELSRASEASRLGEGWRLGFAGDTFNTALYMQRLGVPVAYLTVLGTDPYSADLRAAWAAEGIDLSLVLCDPDRLPGLYAIQTNPGGERSFSYWRSQSAARRLFRLPGTEAALQQAGTAEMFYLSGITLSLYSADERARIGDLAQAVRERGGQVAFDPNYRPAGWPALDQARHAFRDIAKHVSIALPTFDDERQLWGDARPELTIERWRRYGVTEVAMKLGQAGCLIGNASTACHVPAAPVAHVIDTTGAGDSFNAAYLAARRMGKPPEQAAVSGNQLAAAVIQHRGAIIPQVDWNANWSGQLYKAS